MRVADGKLLAIAGMGYIYARDRDCMFWKRISVVVTMEGNHILVSLKDQKCLLLIEQIYPKFLGCGKYSRKDSGVDSGSESDEDNSTTDSESGETTVKHSMFVGDIGADEIEVWEGSQNGNEVILEVRYPEGAELSATDCAEANAVAVMHRLGRYAPSSSSLTLTTATW